jgi:hypothetical protein
VVASNYGIGGHRLANFPREAHGSQGIEDTAIEVIDLGAVRYAGSKATARAVEHLLAPALEGFWIHLDADVLDDAIMPAVDCRMPDGLTWDELATGLRESTDSAKAVTPRYCFQATSEPWGVRWHVAGYVGRRRRPSNRLFDYRFVS